MLIPPLIDPEQICGADMIDANEEVVCTCGKKAKLRAIKLVWARSFDKSAAGNAWHACCGQDCYLGNFVQGSA